MIQTGKNFFVLHKHTAKTGSQIIHAGAATIASVMSIMGKYFFSSFQCHPAAHDAMLVIAL